MRASGSRSTDEAVFSGSRRVYTRPAADGCTGVAASTLRMSRQAAADCCVSDAHARNALPPWLG